MALAQKTYNMSCVNFLKYEQELKASGWSQKINGHHSLSLQFLNARAIL